jgi:hypothetical protein
MYLLNHGSSEGDDQGDHGGFVLHFNGDRGYRRLRHGYMGWTGLGLVRHSLFNAYCDTFFLIIFGLLGPQGWQTFREFNKGQGGIRRASMLCIS